MTPSLVFTSWLAPYFESFVALRRACGAVYVSQKRRLLAFDRYVAKQAAQPPLVSETLLFYLVTLQHLSPRARDNVVTVIWGGVSYAQRHGAAVEALPMRPSSSPKQWRQRPPHIFSAADVASILAAARRSPPVSSLRPVTIATLLGLLATTGVRIGEALALDVGDLDRQGRMLTIRKGKFGKTRALPLRESTAQALSCYIDHPLRRLGTDTSAPLLVLGRSRLSYSTAQRAFRGACLTAGLDEPLPRIHDLRHTFAVNRVAAWYEQGQDVNARLPALSTYLGHVSVEKTRRYLVTNGILLEQAALRFGRQTSALDEVLP
ncbi:MAG: tyrosine-type recombinase/integrase [Acidobacteria bacterium]|nr:tyrosine-type recombinase/integrase [Acidobacteriota bacterium]